MEPRQVAIAARARRAAIACAAALAATIIMTWPLAAGMSSKGRSTGGGDGLYSVWNVAWVARTLVADPANLFNANIFFPHRHALAFSEANLGAGIIAVPAWWLTRSAYAAHNTAVLAAFATALLGMWLLARRLTGDAWAAGVAGLLFAFCPYLFSHTAHIQLLMAGGLPLSMLMFHRLADRPSPARGVALGLTLAAQALSSAYYGIFAGMMIGYASLFVAATRALWTERRYWFAVGIAAATSMAAVLPFFLPYLSVRQEHKFGRSLGDAERYAANLQSYVASPAHAHTWLLALTAGWPRWIEALFPGFLTIALGLAGLGLALRLRRDTTPPSQARETALLYGSIAALACWASFGPQAGLYLVLFRLPLFSFLRAPSRFGLLVTLALAVLAAMAIRDLRGALGARRGAVAAACLGLAALVELNVLPFPWERAQGIPGVYAALSRMPRAPVAEFPFYGERPVFHLHTQYMLFSTAHWMPLVNGYSDVIPQDFREAAPALASFPSRDTFRLLGHYRVRYIAIHWDMYVSKADDVRRRLEPFAVYLRPLGSDSTMTLYEIVGFP